MAGVDSLRLESGIFIEPKKNAKAHERNRGGSRLEHTSNLYASDPNNGELADCWEVAVALRN